jgi:hypothetical protein
VPLCIHTNKQAVLINVVSNGFVSIMIWLWHGHPSSSLLNSASFLTVQVAQVLTPKTSQLPLPPLPLSLGTQVGLREVRTPSSRRRTKGRARPRGLSPTP